MAPGQRLLLAGGNSTDSAELINFLGLTAAQFDSLQWRVFWLGGTLTFPESGGDHHLKVYRNSLETYPQEELLDQLTYQLTGLFAGNPSSPHRDSLVAITREYYDRNLEGSFDPRQYRIRRGPWTVVTHPPFLVRTGDLPHHRQLGEKLYEFADHLGNVRAVITDRRASEFSGNNLIFGTEIVSWSDYYPFGMQMPGRNFSTDAYRFGFQGQETDDEVYGPENAVSYKYRVQDPRLGRFLSVDPLAGKYPWYSPYAFSGNRVLDMVELEGLEPTPYALSQAVSKNRTREEIVAKSGSREAKLQLQRDQNIAMGVVAGMIYIPALIEAAPSLWFLSHTNPVAAEEILRTGAEIVTGADMGPTANDVGEYALKEVVIQSKSSNWFARKWRGFRSWIGRGFKKAPSNTVLSKIERVQEFVGRLESAEPVTNPREAIELINRELDTVEDLYSGVNKNPDAINMPNVDDGRMYGILDDKYVAELPEGGLRAYTRKNTIILDENGGFKIYIRDRSNIDNQTGKLIFEKTGRE